MRFTQKDLLGNKCSSEQYYAQFVDDQTMSIVRNSTTYKHIVKTKEDDYLNTDIDKSFMNITIKQWDSVTANLLCYLKNKYRNNATTKDKVIFNQSALFMIAKLSAKKILVERRSDSCLT